MKTIVTASPIIASNNMQGSIMGMDAQGMNTATYFMRDKIYSNKIGAVVREYACNAVDEHKKYSIDRPVEIGIRNEGSDSIFFCRDFAQGLDEDGVRNIFGMYFRSTKSSDNESIGGFGVGSKAGHCYSDTFFVTSYHNGVKSTYTCMLGGGETGVPVGHIYKIDECPTDESGLEISLSVKRHDVSNFYSEIRNFVSFSPSPIIGCRFSDEPIKSPDLLLEREIDGIKFRVIHAVAGVSSNYIYVQMGGVTYDRVEVTSGYSIKNGVCVIADLPIGSMSIPISREAFEKTAANLRMLNKVSAAALQWAEEDLSQFKDKNPLQLLDDALIEMDTRQYSGEVFSAYKNKIYSNVWGLICNISRVNKEEIPVAKKNDKPILVLVPTGAISNQYWVDKVKGFAKSTNTNYYLSSEFKYSSPNINQEYIDEFFSIICAKKLPYPKNKKDAQRFTIYGGSGSIGSVSPLEFYNYICKQVGLPEVTSVAEGKKQTEKYLKTSKLNSLYNFTIGLRGTAYSRNCKIGYWTNSANMIRKMQEFGCFQGDSPEWKKVAEVKVQEFEKEQEIHRMVHACKLSFTEFNARTQNLISSNPKHAERMMKKIVKINNEINTLRGKIWHSINSGYYSKPRYSRQEVRQILNMK